ncbi:MAG: DUF1294 domain-containing protein [Tissierellaceae bacterium]|nr:DUF1294 domain-containing protein [Tissierellaceae bacterium]
MRYLSYFFIFINVVSFILFTIDKLKAKRNKWRIPEAWLFFVSLIGGSLGGLLSMNIMKHKTSKMSFIIGMPMLLIVNFLSWFYLGQLF